MNTEKIKKDFPILENRKIAYLDSGATTQKPIQVIKAVEEFYEKYNANPHRGAYTLSMEATEIYEETRTKITNFINAKHREEIIFSKNATESLNLIAYSYGMDNLKKDDEVVISIMEHHSNLVPWQKVCKATGSKLNYMYINDEFEISDEEIESKITDKTKIVGITHVSNVLGTINNVKKIIKYAHKKGAVVIVDASQSIPHMKIDVQTLLDGNCIFVEFKGALTEQFVLNEIIYNSDIPCYYWSSEKGNAEVDFLIQMGKYNIPIEVKANENLQAKSLKSFVQKYNTKINIRTSMSDYRKEEWLINIPLYCIGNIKNIDFEN